MNSELSAKCTKWCCRFLALVVIVMIFAFPGVLRWLKEVRSMSDTADTAVTAGFYLCVPVALFALWNMDRLVGNVLKKQVFVVENVSFIRRIRWCCAGVSGLCIVPAWYYPPLWLMVVIMAFLALVVSLVKNVMAAAVELREENDLTV